MSANTGWRLHRESDGFAASLWGPDGTDIITVKGFESRLEIAMFIALYLVFLISSRNDKATQLLREFTSRARPS